MGDSAISLSFMTEQTFIARLPDGKYVGNLISGTAIRNFVGVDDRANACEFFTIGAALSLCAEHGANGVTIEEKPEAEEHPKSVKSWESYL